LTKLTRARSEDKRREGTIRAWEQGKREPGGATRRLLEVAERHPEVILDAVAPKEEENGR